MLATWVKTLYKPLSLYSYQSNPWLIRICVNLTDSVLIWFIEAISVYWKATINSKVWNTLISFVVAIAEVYKNDGNDEYNKKNFNGAIHSYTEGIKVNCKDEGLNAKLYSNRAAAHFNLGKSCYVLAFKYLVFGLLNWLASMNVLHEETC